jgi:hypothetical protein
MKLQVSKASLTHENAPLGTIISRVLKLSSPSILKGVKTNWQSDRSVWKIHCLLNFSLSLLLTVLYLDMTNTVL